MCADLSDARLRAMQDSFRDILPTKDYREILGNSAIQAVVIATPTKHHYSIVKESLLSGKDVLCEKPICDNSAEAAELIDLSAKNGRILMVGHVFLFNAGIRKVKQLIDSGECGRLYYMHSERTNLGPFRNDVSSVWDLASHDVAIFNYLLNAMPKEVTACGGKYLQSGLEDVAFISMTYPDDVLVNVHVSWLDPRKVREITVVGDKKMVMWDDLDMTGPVKIYNREVVKEYFYESFGEFHLLAKEGDITIPKVQLCEPLKAQAAHFIDCVLKRSAPMTDGVEAKQVVDVLSAAQKSMKLKGAPVALN